MKNILMILMLISVFCVNAKTVKVKSASEISAAMSTAQPGDTLMMLNGIWTNERILFKGQGVADNPIVLIAETPGMVLLNGTSTLRLAGNYLEVNGLYFYKGYSSSGAVVEFRYNSGDQAYNCRLTNTAIVDYNPSSNSTDYKWISLYGQNNRVDHCYLRGKNHDGTTLVVWLDGQANYHLIDSNYFAFRPELGRNGAESIRIGTSDYSMTDSYTTVEYNYFEQCNGEVEIISNKSGHNTFRYNTFFESQGALTLRHGNFAEVYGNFFIGNNKPNTGGVRVIGEDHKVYNNYFENLKGTSNRAALPIMNGVPNSPLNRYFQVKRAQIVNNTFINCAETFIIGNGADSELSLPPVDCRVANNVVQSTYRMISYDSQPINLLYEGNILFGGPVGIELQEGITVIDPMISVASDGMYRPSASSPVIDASVGNYNFVQYDVDGQSRININDVGGDEISNEPVLIGRMSKDNAGPRWYPPAEIPIKVIKVSEGIDSLAHAISIAGKDDIIELITESGNYSNTSALVIDKKVKIRSAAGTSIKPVIRNIGESSESKKVFELTEGSTLCLSGVTIDGISDSQTGSKYLISSSENAFTKSCSIFIDSCLFRNVNNSSAEGNILRMGKGSLADSIIITNSLFTNSGSSAIRLNEENSNSGKYNVNNLIISNSTFWNIKGEAISAYGGDNVIFTAGPQIRIDHCTFDNIGSAATAILDLKDCDNTIISNSAFTNSSSAKSIMLYSQLAKVDFSNFYNSGVIEAFNGAVVGTSITNIDPIYPDPANGDFTLPSNSLLLTGANDGKAIGDLRWAVNEPSYTFLKIMIVGMGEVLLSPEYENDIYNIGDEVTLTAVAAEGFVFDSWSGDISGDQPVIKITMDERKDIIAVFKQLVNVEGDSEYPEEFELFTNYPNPFNPSTKIKFALPVQSMVELKLYDLNGSLINTIAKNNYSPGYHELELNMKDYSSGVYLVVMLTAKKIFTNKIILIK